MAVKLQPVDSNHDGQLQTLFSCYVVEMRHYLDPDDTKTRALEPAAILARYWAGRPRWPYLIDVDGTPAGFCLLRRYPGEPNTLDIDQFYVARQFRRRGVGSAALEQLVSRHPGSWLIRVLGTNPGGLEFWRSSIEELVGPHYTCRDEGHGMYFIRFTSPPTTSSYALSHL